MGWLAPTKFLSWDPPHLCFFFFFFFGSGGDFRSSLDKIESFMFKTQLGKVSSFPALQLFSTMTNPPCKLHLTGTSYFMHEPKKEIPILQHGTWIATQFCDTNRKTSPKRIPLAFTGNSVGTRLFGTSQQYLILPTLHRTATQQKSCRHRDHDTPRNSKHANRRTISRTLPKPRKSNL